MARNQAVRGSLVAWKWVPASRESWCLQRLHWNVARWVERQQNLSGPRRAQARRSGQCVEEGLLALRLEAVELEERCEAEAFFGTGLCSWARGAGFY